MKTSLEMTCGRAHRATAQSLRLPLVLALLVLAIALLAGCGGGEDDTETQRGSTQPVDCRTAPPGCT